MRPSGAIAPPAPRPRRWSSLVAMGIAAALAGCAALPDPRPSDDADEAEEPVAASIPERAATAVPTEADDRAHREPVVPAEPAAAIGPPPRLDDGAALFARLASGFTAPVCVRGEHNRQWRRRYAGHPEAFERQLRSALPLMAWVVEEVDARGLPMEFALIPIVESGFRPDARGPGGPTGLWQMIGSTARNHGIAVRGGYDGRLSPVASTRGALDYLAALQAEFGDWRAAAMAYNAGEGRLRRALARSGGGGVSAERRLPPGLSPITYAYVAKLQALACLIAEPRRHGLNLPTEPFVPLETREAPHSARSLDAVARAWNVEPALLSALNPAYRAGLPAPGRAPRVLLHPRLVDRAPDDGTASVAASSAASGAAQERSTAEVAAALPRRHVVRSGDTLWRIARAYGTTVSALAAANGLRVDRPLRIGMPLEIPE